MISGTLAKFFNEAWRVSKLALWKSKIEDSGGSEVIGYIFWEDICIVIDYVPTRAVSINDENLEIGSEAFILTQNGLSGWIEADALICI